VTLLNSALGLILFNKGLERISRRLDIALIVILPAAYCVLCFRWIFG